MDTTKEIKVRNDGEEVQITFTGDSGDHAVTLSVNDAIRLELELVKSVVGARVNASEVSDLPKEFTELPEVILVNGFEILLMTDDSLTFVIQTREGRTVQVAFHDHHISVLRQALANI